MTAALTLCYHAVSDTWERALALPEARLLRQVRVLKRAGFRSCTAAEAAFGHGRRFHVTFDDAFARIGNTLSRLLDLGVHHSVYVCTTLADRGGAPLVIPELAQEPRYELATLGWDELRALASAGTEIYSHTASHPHLPLLSDAELRFELGSSRERLVDEMGRPCPFLAYPFGEHDARVRAAAQAAGYEAAFALGRSGIMEDRFALPRVGIYRKDTLPRVLAKATPLVRRRFYGSRA
jgi:peptidoglycan/xylan/chitin deacetylase (PgdA/CDA1 family)